jgi:hypothetical protein
MAAGRIVARRSLSGNMRDISDCESSPMQEMLRNLVMVVWPDGGLGTARRNAWAAMAADAKRARQRAEAAAFLNTVGAVPDTPAAAVAQSHG